MGTIQAILEWRWCTYAYAMWIKKLLRDISMLSSRLFYDISANLEYLCLEAAGYQSLIRIMSWSLYGLLPSPPGLYHRAPMRFSLSCEHYWDQRSLRMCPVIYLMKTRATGFYTVARCHCEQEWPQDVRKAGLSFSNLMIHKHTIDTSSCQQAHIVLFLEENRWDESPEWQFQKHHKAILETLRKLVAYDKDLSTQKVTYLRFLKSIRSWWAWRPYLKKPPS